MNGENDCFSNFNRKLLELEEELYLQKGNVYRKESEQRFLSCVPECVSERSLHLARHCG